MKKTLKKGPILCTAGPHQGRIGYLDDFGMDCTLCPEICCVKIFERSRESCSSCTDLLKKHGACPAMAIVYFGRIPFCSEYVFLPVEHCTNEISPRELVFRILALEEQLGRMSANKKKALLSRNKSTPDLCFMNTPCSLPFPTVPEKIFCLVLKATERSPPEFTAISSVWDTGPGFWDGQNPCFHPLPCRCRRVLPEPMLYSFSCHPTRYTSWNATLSREHSFKNCSAAALPASLSFWNPARCLPIYRIKIP